MQKRSVILGVLACALSMFVGVRANASYTYSPETYTFSGGTGGVTFLNNGTGTVTATSSDGLTRIIFSVPTANPAKGVGTSTLNLGDVTATTAAPNGAPSPNFSFNFSDSIPIVNTGPPGTNGSGTLLYTGTITVTNASVGNGQVTPSNLAVAGGPTVIGLTTFTIDTPTFGFATLNGTTGNVSANITQTASVPAPASIVILGLGMGAMGLVRVSRRFRAA